MLSRKARSRCLATAFQRPESQRRREKCLQTSIVLPAQAGEPFVQFIEPFLARREIRASYARIGYGVDRGGRFADLVITVNGGVLDLQAKVA
jgi:hypothetical protein